MAIISLTIIQSKAQILAGIPKSVSISTNIPATIFYTLDGSIPDLFSSIYVSAIQMPTDKLSIVLNVFASNGVDSSPIISETYLTNMLDNTRLPHSTTTGGPSQNIYNPYPFGTNSPPPNVPYISPANAGVTVDNPDLPTVPSGFDGSGNANNFTNSPFNVENYQIPYGIGTLPAEVKIKLEETPAETTNQFSNYFDPKASVIFQNFDDENPDDPSNINKQFFSLQDPNKVSDGNQYYSSGLDTPVISGSFVKSHFNPRTGMINYYYYDNSSAKWLISSQKFVANGSFNGNMATMVFGRNSGVGKVFEWIPFARRVLF